MILHLCVLIELRPVTDGQTDGHRAVATTALALASRGKKIDYDNDVHKPAN